MELEFTADVQRALSPNSALTIIQFLKENPKTTVKEIMKKTHMKEDTVRKTLKRLVDVNIIIREGRIWYDKTTVKDKKTGEKIDEMNSYRHGYVYFLQPEEIILKYPDPQIPLFPLT